MIDKIEFTNYKSFKGTECLELKPLTVLIGKNSSGKSAVVKLPTLIEGSLSGESEDPILTTNNGVELGAEFRDLVYGKEIGSLEFKLSCQSNYLAIEVASGLKDSELPRIRRWQKDNSISLVYNDIANSYRNVTKNETELFPLFKGFNLVGYEVKDGLSILKSDLSDIGITLTTNYIGPLRETPRRTYNSTGKSRAQKVGNKGENAYQIIVNDYLYGNGQLLEQVSNWYKSNFEGWGIQVNSSSRPDFKVELYRDNPKFSINICDVGQGMSQAFPLIVSAYYNQPNEILTIIEQPELHLHPAAHGNLAELFVDSAVKGPGKFLIESHSQNFVLRLRRLVAEGKLSPQLLSMYSVEYDKELNLSTLKKINVRSDGSVDFWPEKVFSETLTETIAIHSARKKDGNGS